MRRFWKEKSVQWYKTIATILVISIVTGTLAVGGDIYSATPEGNKNQAESELEGVNSEIENITENQEQTQAELSKKAELLSELLADKALLEKEIEETQKAIEETDAALEEAKKREAEGYEAMKLRIQYMYLNSTENSFWAALLNARGLTDLLNRIEYISQVYKTDRELMSEYTATVEEVKALAETLEIEMNNLLTLQENYEHQQEELELAMEELKNEMDDYEEQIAAAEARAVELVAYIEEQNRLIREEEERRRKEEEERRQKEEEERKRKEEEEKKKQEEEKNSQSEAEKESETVSESETESEYVDLDPSEVSGEDIVAYALKFVGNPYKWGGNSLTEGCDCSGFVNLIYSHFGFTNVPRQSQSFKTYGVAVEYQDIQPGDIVVYPGHVAIYIGNGRIVEAQSKRAGITCNRSVTSSRITAIRRVIGYEEQN